MISSQGCPAEFGCYDGELLRLARDLGDRLLPAFDTPTGIPYGTVNLHSGVPPGETPIASTAAAGTLMVEFEMLSYLAENGTYGKYAAHAQSGEVQVIVRIVTSI